MEVDRVSRVGGVGGNATPAWQNSAKRRRRFVEEVEPPESEEEDLLAESDDSPEDGSTISVRDTEGAREDDGGEKSFQAIA